MSPIGTHRQLSSNRVWLRLVEGELRHRAAARNKFQQALSGVNTSTEEKKEPVLTQNDNAEKQTTPTDL
jgi:hypothetical protein